MKKVIVIAAFLSLMNCVVSQIIIVNDNTKPFKYTVFFDDGNLYEGNGIVHIFKSFKNFTSLIVGDYDDPEFSNFSLVILKNGKFYKELKFHDEYITFINENCLATYSYKDKINLIDLSNTKSKTINVPKGFVDGIYRNENSAVIKTLRYDKYDNGIYTIYELDFTNNVLLEKYESDGYSYDSIDNSSFIIYDNDGIVKFYFGTAKSSIFQVGEDYFLYEGIGEKIKKISLLRKYSGNAIFNIK